MNTPDLDNDKDEAERQEVFLIDIMKRGEEALAKQEREGLREARFIKWVEIAALTFLIVVAALLVFLGF